MVPGVLLKADTKYFTIVESVGSYYNMRDYLSVVLDGAAQAQPPLSILSTSNVTATIFKEDGLEQDQENEPLPTDICKDEDAVSSSASPVLRESLGIPMVS